MTVTALRPRVTASVCFEVVAPPYDPRSRVFVEREIPGPDHPFIFPIGVEPGRGSGTTVMRLWRGPRGRLVVELEADHPPVCLVRWARIEVGFPDAKQGGADGPTP